MVGVVLEVGAVGVVLGLVLEVVDNSGTRDLVAVARTASDSRGVDLDLGLAGGSARALGALAGSVPLLGRVGSSPQTSRR